MLPHDTINSTTIFSKARNALHRSAMKLGRFAYETPLQDTIVIVVTIALYFFCNTLFFPALCVVVTTLCTRIILNISSPIGHKTMHYIDKRRWEVWLSVIPAIALQYIHPILGMTASLLSGILQGIASTMTIRKYHMRLTRQNDDKENPRL